MDRDSLADRWRAAPWLVLLFGVVLVALALTGLALIVIQLVLVRSFCGLCLASAAISFINAWLGRDEVILTFNGARCALARGTTLRRALRGPLEPF